VDRNVRSSESVPPLRLDENDDSVHGVCVCVMYVMYVVEIVIAGCVFWHILGSTSLSC